MLFQPYFSVLLVFVVSSAVALNLTPLNGDPLDPNPPATSKRDASFTGDLDLQDFESFYWGAQAGNKLIYANLTVFFPEDYRYVISMDRFAGKLKSVQCEEPEMVLEFNNDPDFEYAKGIWNWVNSNVNHSFIMVTNYAPCQDEAERMPFIVSNIRYDDVANKAYLAADMKEWEEIAHSYTLNVGHTPLTPTHRLLMARNLVPRGPDFTMDLTSGYDKNLFSTTVGGWTTSVDAVVRTVGSLNVDFDIDVDWFKLKSAAMTVNPENVAASIQLALTESGTLSKAYNWKQTIISIPIEGIEIAKVVKLGAFLDVDVGFTMEEWTGKATANFGARMEISNAATVKIDLVNSKNNAFSGWTPSFSPIPLTLSAKIEGSAKVYAEPNVKLEASALGKGWNVGLNLQMPYIQADFAAMADTTGVCGTKKTLGVDIDARVGIELHAQAATKGNEANPFWEQELYSHEWELFSKCLPFGPNNAHSGEVADPNPPASKTKKSKSKSKHSKTSSTKKPSSTKHSKTSKSTPSHTSASTTHKSSSKKSTDATPTKTKKTKKTSATDSASSSHSGKSSATDKPSGSFSPTGTKKSSSTGKSASGSHKSSSTGDLPSESHQSTDRDIPSSKASHTSEASESSGVSSYSSHSGKHSSASHSVTDLTSSSSSSTMSWGNSTRPRSHTKHTKHTKEPGEPSATNKDAPSSANEPTPPASVTDDGSPTVPNTSQIGKSTLPGSKTGGEGTSSQPTGSDKQSASSGAGSSLSSSITAPPSSLSSHLSASSSRSSSSADICDLRTNQCKTCKDGTYTDDETREYFAMEVDGLPDSTSNATTHALLKRASRLYKYMCDGRNNIYMAEYPTYTTLTNGAGKARGSTYSCTINSWYQAADVDDCLNHRITTTKGVGTAPPPESSPRWAAEHVYEGNWIVEFLRHLRDDHKISCADQKALFWSKATTNNLGTTYIQALMESLGSYINQDQMVFLKQNINGAKHRMFSDDEIIADKRFKAFEAQEQIENMAVVGRAIDYMSDDHIGSILLKTIEKVEDTLQHLAAAAAIDPSLQGKLGKLESGTKLASVHRSWLHNLLKTKNIDATNTMKSWAHVASDKYEHEHPGTPRTTVSGTHTVHADKTLKFLHALKTDAPTGFDANKYAPLLP